MKAWNGRFKESTNEFMDEFNQSLSFDKRMYKEDILGSIAHTKMLFKINVLNNEEQIKIINGLKNILEQFESGSVLLEKTDEDIHMAVERILIDMIGVTGKKLHTGRSRNDQVATDLRMFTRKAIKDIMELIVEFIEVLTQISSENLTTIMPGYTHLQRAQPVTLSFHMMAYVHMLKRDYDRCNSAYKRMNELPLGSGAFSGVNYDTDREYLCNLLDFDTYTSNAMDGISDRDFVLDFHNITSTMMMHLSRLSEDLILWSSSEFGFITLSDAYTTGSSIMPQKKNPDACELVRGKTGRVYGNLVAMLVVMKGLPMSYNKDMQEDKEGLFDSYDTVTMSLKVYIKMMKTCKFNVDTMFSSTKNGYLNATDLADFLVSKGISFREAHNICGRVTAYCIGKSSTINELDLNELKLFSDSFTKEVYEWIDIKKVVERKKSKGSTNTKEVEYTIKETKKWITIIKDSL